MKAWGKNVKWGFIEDKYLGFNIRKGWSPNSEQYGYFATKKGLTVPLCTQQLYSLDYVKCRSILRVELIKRKEGEKRAWWMVAEQMEEKMSDEPQRCLQCGLLMIRKSYRLYFCSEECHEAFTYDSAQYEEDNKEVKNE